MLHISGGDTTNDRRSKLLYFKKKNVFVLDNEVYIYQVYYT